MRSKTKRLLIQIVLCMRSHDLPAEKLKTSVFYGTANLTCVFRSRLLYQGNQ